jgi:hypothetical protein
MIAAAYEAQCNLLNQSARWQMLSQERAATNEHESA